MATYTPIPPAALQIDKPVTTTTMTALADNPTAIAERATGAPVVQIPRVEYFTAIGAGTWEIPDGVTAIELTVTGAGASAVTNETWAEYDGYRVTAYSGYRSYGGSSAGGDISIIGGGGSDIISGGSMVQGGASYWGGGASGHTPNGAGAWGSGGLDGWSETGGAGGTAIKRLEVTAGEVLDYYVNHSPDLGAGYYVYSAQGIVVVRY